MLGFSWSSPTIKIILGHPKWCRIFSTSTVRCGNRPKNHHGFQVFFGCFSPQNPNYIHCTSLKINKKTHTKHEGLVQMIFLLKIGWFLGFHLNFSGGGGGKEKKQDPNYWLEAYIFSQLGEPQKSPKWKDRGFLHGGLMFLSVPLTRPKTSKGRGSGKSPEDFREI